MNFDLMRSLLIDRALRGELSAYSNSVAAEEKSLNEQKTKPFQIPYDWQWKCVADCVQFNPKVIQDDTAEVSFIPMADVEPGFVDQCSTRQTKLWAKVKKGFSRFQEGDLLVAKITPCFQNRKSCVAKNLTNGTGAGSTEFHVMRCVSGVDAKFLLFFFKSEYFIRYGVNHFNGTVGQQRVGTQDIKDCLVPVPPFEEQTRIVEKLEAAFVEIDRAEKAYEELQTLSGVLRGQILQKAIQGQLVTQLDTEPSVEMIGDAPVDVPFAIPEKWKWVKLKSVFSMQAGKFISASSIQPEGKYPCYGGNGLRGYVDVSNRKGRFPLIGRQGALCGNVHVVDGDFYATEHAVVVDCREYGDPDCVGLFLEAINLNQYATATAQPGLSVKKIVELPFPLPPKDEQVRIVSKVKDLMKQVDALSAK